MRSDIKREVTKMGSWGIALGVLCALCGILAIGAPLAAGVVTTYLVGGLLLAAGLSRIIWAFSAPSLVRGLLRALFGGITFLAGIAVIAQPLVGLVSLTVLLAAYFIADGVMEVAAAFDVRPNQGWGWLLFAGIAGLVLGALIIAEFPLSGAWAVGTLVGVHLILSGATMIAFGAAAHSGATHAAARA